MNKQLLDKIDKKTQGKRNLEKGRRFENKVRKDLESKGWIVSRWQNNVELVCTKVEPLKENPNFVKEVRFIGELIPARQGRFRKTSTGFPDFIAYKIITLDELYQKLRTNTKVEGIIKTPTREYNNLADLFKAASQYLSLISLNIKSSIKLDFVYIILGIECKTNGYLTKEEKEKCKWLLENNIFSKIFIASKGKKGEIIYKEFKNE